MDHLESLARVSLFALMKRSDLKRLAKMCRHHRFEKGGLITAEGDRDGRLFVILKGRVEVVKGLGSQNQRTLTTLGPDMYFGEMALVDDFTRTASVVAKEDVEALSLDQWDFREAIKKYPSIAVELLQTLARRIRSLEKELA